MLTQLRQMAAACGQLLDVSLQQLGETAQLVFQGARARAIKAHGTTFPAELLALAVSSTLPNDIWQMVAVVGGTLLTDCDKCLRPAASPGLLCRVTCRHGRLCPLLLPNTHAHTC